MGETETTTSTPRPRTRRKKNRLLLVGSVLNNFGVYALIGTAVLGVVVYLGSTRQIDKANEKIGDLLVRVGNAEERARQLEKQSDKYEELIARLSKTDVDHVNKVLDVVEKPSSDEMLKADKLREDISALGKQVAMVYWYANWASKDEQREIHGDVFRLAIRMGWEIDRGLEEQRASGVVSKANPRLNELDEKLVRASVGNYALAETLDANTRKK